MGVFKLKSVFLFASLALLQTSSAIAGPAGKIWSDAHPEARATLEHWARTYPKAAKVLVQWEREHPLRAKYFWNWAVAHPGLGSDDFSVEHADWPVVGDIMKRHRMGVDALVAWFHAHPAAAQEISSEPGRWGNVCEELFGDVLRTRRERTP